MNKVYVVTSGSYSDYHIEAVFSTEELAEKYIHATKSGNRWDDASIEEWDLDRNASELRAGYKAYFGRISKEGNISDLEESTLSLSDGHGFDVKNNMYCGFFAQDAEHARKILAERHAVISAEGWPEPWSKK